MAPPTRIFTRRDIESLIASGDTIVIFDGYVLRLNGWGDRHPGGDLVFKHTTGKDATDEINMFHSAATLQTMHRYRIGKINGHWENLTPPIQGGVYTVHEDVKITNKVDGYVDEDKAANPLASDLADSASDDSAVGRRMDSLCGPAKVDELDATPSTTIPFSSEKPLSPETYISDSIQDDIDVDLATYPSLDAATQYHIATKFRALHQRVKDDGYYDCRFVEYGKELTRYVALFAAFVSFLHHGWYFVSACFLGLFWHQIMFTAHDAGHRGITHDYTTDTLIGIFIADFCCGLSIGWWKSSHNVHHLVPNVPEHDPDIQNVPLFATSPSFFTSLKSTYYGITFPWDAAAAIAVTVQKYTYYPIMALARFNLYILSWSYLLSPRSRTKGKTAWTRPAEIACISAYMFLYFYFLLYRSIPTWTSRAIFLLTSHLVTMPLHVQITLSHWGTSTADLGPAESFAQRQLRTTMDVACPAWLDFVHGGLQFQAVHHLFPRVPRHNLRRLQGLVKGFCEETEITYLIHGFVEGNGKVLGKLQQVANQARILAACQEHMAATGESGLH